MSTPKKPKDSAILERVEKWFPAAKAYWGAHNERFNKIKRFTKVHGEHAQWDTDTWNSRDAAKRITLEENLLGPFVNREVNKLRRAEFVIQIKPKDDGTDPRLAKVRQALHRGVRQMGGWKDALGQCADDEVTAGRGAFRLVAERADPSTFRKEIRYLTIKDPTRVFHGDGTHQKPDYSDVTDSLIYEPYSAARFKSEFNKDPKDFLGKSGCCPVWGQGNVAWVSEYFFKEEIPDTLVMYKGKEHYLSDLEEKLEKAGILGTMGMKAIDLADFGEDMEPIQEKTTRCQIWWCKIAGREVLKVEAWPGSWIPVFIANGREVVVDGETRLYGLAEPAVDAQRRHNFAVSAHSERLALAPKAPYTIPVEGIPATHTDVWNTANAANHQVLPYNAFFRDSTGNTHAIPQPQRTPPIASDPAILDILTSSQTGIKGTLGMWESSLGAPSNETANVAIQTREQQTDTGNYDWGANLAIAAEHAGRVTDELLSKIIDVPTQVRIVGEDDKEAVIWAAALEENDPNPGGYFNLNQGKFDLFCKMASSTDTKRDEAVQGMQSLFQSAPQFAEAMGDLWIKEQDWRLADEAAERARRFIGMKYPGLIEGGQGQDPQVAALQQQLQQATAQMQKLTSDFEAMKLDKAVEARKLQIEAFNAETDRMRAIADVRNKDNDITKAKIDAAAQVAVAQAGGQSAQGEPAPQSGFPAVPRR